MAPMAGVTDRAFRTLMRGLHSSVVITELVSANGLEYGSKKTQKLMEYDESQRPIGVQLFGETAEVIARGAKFVEEQGADFVDMNFGCPVPKVVKKGAGSALLKDLVALRDVLRTVKSQVNIPVTIKIRTGWDMNSRNADKVVQVAYDEGIEWVAIHGRTRAAAYTGRADWDYISEVKAKSPLPILGNGDILTAQSAVEKMKETGVDGLMIGRGCLKNPWIFKESLDLWQGNRVKPQSKTYLQVYERLYELLLRENNDRIMEIQLKKFASWYSAGFPGSAGFRKRLFRSENTLEVLSMAREFFSDLHLKKREDQSEVQFLMGGHG